ncbi:MAG: glyoxalase [Actinobacteria bacterium]|nr:glyoxalase [Actinomycetota bacterium]
MAHPVVHFEVSGKDLDKLQTFYTELFGWNTQKVPGDMPYAMVEKEDGGIGGGIGQAPDGNGHVTFYVDTDDPQATLDKAEQLGRQDDPAGDGAAADHHRDVRRRRGPRRRARERDVS